MEEVQEDVMACCTSEQVILTHRASQVCLHRKTAEQTQEALAIILNKTGAVWTHEHSDWIALALKSYFSLST